jgi:hypothetical protein
MRKRRTILWTGILLLFVGALGWGWHLYDKRHKSAAEDTADVTISADSLYHDYSTDEHAADGKYLGKVIAVTGRLTEVRHTGTSVIWILSTQPGGGGINCQIFAGTKIDPEPHTGDPVTVKGRCTGFLMDVNLADCVPEK